jgi:hypothetical protein
MKNKIEKTKLNPNITDQGCNKHFYNPNVCVPEKFICWNLITEPMVLKGGAFRKWLGKEIRSIPVLLKWTHLLNMVLEIIWKHINVVLEIIWKYLQCDN